MNDKLIDKLKNNSNTDFVKCVAPMVRYSKLPFRLLCRRYNSDLCYTPMIMASTFVSSEKSREVEFTTIENEGPLIAQFASNDPIELLKAVQMVEEDVDGVDLNCGCPQKWILKEKKGASLIDKPELVKEMVMLTKENVRNNLNVSIKIRIHDNLRKTIDLVKHAEEAGVDWVTVHGRTILERGQPVHWDAIAEIKRQANVPIFYNGDIFSLTDAHWAVEQTNVDGVMSARGILDNPSLYAGFLKPPIHLLSEYVNIALRYGGKFIVHRYHLANMMSHMNLFTKCDTQIFQIKRSIVSVIDFFKYRNLWDINDSISICSCNNCCNKKMLKC